MLLQITVCSMDWDRALQTMALWFCMVTWLIASYITQFSLVPHICVDEVGPIFAQIMACRLFGAKPLLEIMLGSCKLDTCDEIVLKFESEFYPFHSRKCILKCRVPKWRPFSPSGWDVLICTITYSHLTVFDMDDSKSAKTKIFHWYFIT